MFQSLFSWNSPSDFTNSIKGVVPIACFNPCFRGTRPRTVSKLLYLEKEYSFNPCFRGTRPRTLQLFIMIIILIGFNPCFRGTRPRTACLLFLSSFNLSSFNPCFRGTRPRTVGLLLAFRYRFYVSILVFVELALGLLFPHKFHLWQIIVSILVFVELALGLLYFPFNHLLILCFNPCFRGTRPRTIICAGFARGLS